MVTYNQAGETYDDVDFLYDGFPPTLQMAVTIGDEVGTFDYTGDINWRSFSATDNASSGRGLITFRIEAPWNTLTNIEDQALVTVVSGTLNTSTHRGFIMSRRLMGSPGYDAVEITASDPGGLLDDTYIPFDSRPAETMQARLKGLWLTYKPSFLDGDTSQIASIGSTLEAVEFSGVTLRSAIESTIGLADPDADYFVDMLGVLHVFTASGLTAPINIDNDAPTGGEDAATDLSIDYDTNQFANRVYVNAATEAVSGFYQDDASIAAVDGLIRTTSIDAPEATTATMAAAAAAAYFTRSASPIVRGEFEITGVDGWKGGQNILITDAAKGLSAQSFRIFRVTTRVVRPGATPVFSYRVEFGAAAIAAER